MYDHMRYYSLKLKSYRILSFLGKYHWLWLHTSSDPILNSFFPTWVLTLGVFLSGLPCLIFLNWRLGKYFYFPLKIIWRMGNLDSVKYIWTAETFMSSTPVFLKMLHNFRLLLHSVQSVYHWVKFEVLKY